MKDLLKILFYSSFSGIAVLIGGFWGTKKISNKVMAFILTFGSGILLSILSYSLMHEAYKNSGPVLTSFSFLFGGFFFFEVERLLEKMFSSGTGIILGTALDDLPEALSMGIGFAADNGTLGMVLAVSIFLHNIPEGISSSNELISEGHVSPKTAILLASGIAVLNPILALTGYYLLHGLDQTIIGLIMAFSGGSILFMTGTDMIPKAQKIGNKSANFGLLFGFLTAFLINRIFR